MPFPSAQRITDRIDFAGVIFNHLRLISEGGQHLFDLKSDDTGGTATVSSRLRSYYFQIQAMERFLWSSLSKEYFDVTKESHRKIDDNYMRDNEKYIAGVMDILGNLMIEINNHGWLFKEISNSDAELRQIYDEQQDSE
jgi:hypothetical protein